MNEIEKLVTQFHYKITKKTELINKLLNETIFIWGEIIDGDANKINVNFVSNEGVEYIPVFIDKEMCLSVCPDEVGVLAINGEEFLMAYKHYNIVIHPELEDCIILNTDDIQNILDNQRGKI